MEPQLSQTMRLVMMAYDACATTAENFGHDDLANELRRLAFTVAVEPKGDQLMYTLPVGGPQEDPCA